ncbi:MAG TPA: 6-carboxytetrahydropterin synthase [Tepidisphaeraceae bacterium]|jgi:6-pyruvoyltetrahydropterin/6-carboxytetrahydropterin synthase
MIRLTREVRFAINGPADPQLGGRATNGYAGFPALVGFGPWMSLQVTLSGPLDPVSNYLINIKQIDTTVRELAIPRIAEAVLDGRTTPPQLMARLDAALAAWPPLMLEELKLNLSPFTSLSIRAPERPMMRLSQTFEFSATHRLHNPKATDAENRHIFGKCNNPHGHGHNYEVQVTLLGEPDATGLLIEIPEFERIVAATVIDRFDHKNLNVEVPEFRELIPTVENIAMTTYRLLKPKFAKKSAKLASVTVWETPKTWCEYSEE